MQHDSVQPVATCANAFTVSRVPLGILGIAIFLTSSQLVGVVIIMLAAMTDFLDGFVARRLNQVSKLGAELDPVADKVLMVIILIFAITQVAVVSAVFLALILALEVVIASQTVYARSHYKTVMQVTNAGKAGMFTRMTGVTWLLLSSVSDGQFFDIAAIIGVAASVVGIVCGLIALWQYQGQIVTGKNQ